MAIKDETVLSNRYRIENHLGSGGMSDVYMVWDEQRSTFLAMKVLRADLAEDRVFIRRFKREGENLSRLQHPNIVRYYEMEKDGDLVFLLMDYVEGISLRTEISRKDKPFTSERILEIIRPVCSALHYAHQKNMVHCDVKPANIMIEKSGRILLADFGIARQAEGATTTTMVGAGTPAYMAPEQAQGEDPTPRTDIYALGIVLYEMLTGGERPFTGEMATITGTTGEKVRWEQVNLKPMSPRRFNPQISDELEAVVMKCLEKEPRQRFSGVLELLGALQASLGIVVNSETETNLGENEPAEPKKNCQKNQDLESGQIPPQKADKQLPQKRLSRLLWVGLGIVGIFILVLVFLLSKGTGSAGLSTLQTPTLEQEHTIAPTAKILTAATAVPSINPATALARNDTCQIAFTSDRDGNKEIYVMDVDGSDQRRLTSSDGIDNYPAWSPDGNQIAFSSSREGNIEIYVMNADGSNQHRLTSTSEDDVTPAWSPNGNEIAFASTRGGTSNIYIMNVEGSDQHKLTSNDTADFLPAWSPDGKKIAFNSRHDDHFNISVMDLDGSNQHILTKNDANYYHPAWSPDGNKITFTSNRDGNFEIYVMNADGTSQHRLTSNEKDDYDPEWSPDGKKFIFPSDRDGNYEIYVMNVDGTDQHRLTFNNSEEVDPTWSPLCKTSGN